MPALFTDNGEEWLASKLIGDRPNEDAIIVAVGTGTTDPTETDTSLENEIYRSNDNNSNVTVEPTGNIGEFRAQITVSGGTEISNPPQNISEFGLFLTNSTDMVYRETRNPTTVETGEQVTFEFQVSFEDD